MKEFDYNEYDGLSNIELLDRFLTECVEDLNASNRKFKLRFRHGLILLGFSVLTFLMGYGLFSLVFFIPSIVMLYFINNAHNDLITSRHSLNGCIFFHEENGLLNDSNRYLLDKALRKIEE
jgi:hypothetical protein